MDSFIVEPYEQTVVPIFHDYDLQILIKAGRFRGSLAPTLEQYLSGSVDAVVVEVEVSTGGTFDLAMFHKADYDTLHHESIHITHNIMERCGVPISMENTEIVSYMSTYIVRELLAAKKNADAREKKRKVRARAKKKKKGGSK